jgi:release factor glutamine methyltransferase
VPRRRTEFLVQEAVALGGSVVVDLCCGTAAVGAAIAAALDVTALDVTERGAVELHAVEIDAAAIPCARRNVEPAGGHVYRGDLFTPLPDFLRGRIDLLVANAPYVPTEAIATMPPEARDHEARVALDGGAEGLDVQRRVVASAPAWLAPRGYLLIETSRRQAPHTAEMFRRGGLRARIATSDELDATVVIGFPDD